MAQAPWLGPNEEPVQPSLLNRLDVLIIGMSWLQDVSSANTALIERIKYGLMGHYNNGVAAEEIAELIDWDEEEVGDDG
jgi:hypothetical protein